MRPEPDPAQSPSTNLLTIAPPGCGKTELLARRAVHLVGELQPNQRILALTFSNRATRNLRERLLTALGPQRFRRHIRVTNFHGHAAEIIRAHGRTIGLDPDSPMPGRATLSTAISAITEGMAIGPATERERAVVAALSEAKREAHDDDQVRHALALAGNEDAQAIEEERRTRGILHHDDLLRHAQRLLRIKAVARLYQHHYGAVLVDEFQDLFPQHLEIALATCSANRTFVGDPLQGIYSWAGARPVEVEQTLREVCGEPHHLSVSYRSSPAVLGVVNTLASELDGGSLRAADPASWTDGGVAASKVFGSGREEARWIIDLAERILHGDPTATIGVITRAAWRRGPIDEAFDGVTHLPSRRWDVAIQDSRIVERLIAAVGRLPRKAGMDTVRQLVLEDIDPNEVDTLEQAHEALDEFETLVAQTGTPTAAAAQLRAPDSEDAIEPGVHLLNAHTGKGQQFDWVFIPGLEAFHIPGSRATTRETRKEEFRVLLVMVSRARHGLVITRAESLISKAGNLWHPDPSPWWEIAIDACTEDGDGLLRHLAPRT